MARQNYSLEINSDPNNLITVEEFVNYFAKEIKIDEEKLQHLLLSITEATTNAIIHANKCDQKKKVNIDVVVDNEYITVTIKDEGKGFDPGAIPDPTHPDNLLKDNGRGIYLMKFYMDELKYNLTPTGTETILVIHK